MYGIKALIFIVNFTSFIEKDLPVTQSPIAKEEHQHWSKPEDIEYLLIELIVVHWWLSIVVGQTESFNYVHVTDTDESNWEKYGDK